MRATVAVLLLFLAVPAGAGRPDPAAWQGRSMGIASYPSMNLEVSTAGSEILAGATGGVMGGSQQGSALQQQYAIEDPSLRIAERIAAKARDHYGVVEAPHVSARPLSNPADLVKAAQAVGGIDLILDVVANGFEVQKLFQRRFAVGMNVSARVIDVKTGKTLADTFCLQHATGSFSRDELIANQAEQLKAVLAERADTCLEKLQPKLLKIEP
jgi:hypothetical protein